MPAIITHAGAGVLLIIMTNFASPKPNTTTKSHKNKSPLSRIHIANINNTRCEG